MSAPCAFRSGTDSDWYASVLSKVIFSACRIRDLIGESKNASKVMPYICERDFCIILCLFVQTECVVYAMYVKTVQIQNLLQKSGLHEVLPKKEFNNIMVFTALVNPLHILL